MADDPQTPQTPAETAPAAPGTPQSADPAPQQGQQPGPIPYDRFKQVNDELRALKAASEKQQREQQAAAEAQLKEQGKYKELLEQRERELAELKSREVRSRVATAAGIPAELAERLRGATEAELAEDAKALKALLGTAAKPATPGIPPSGGTSGERVSLKDMTPAQIREAWAKGQLLR